MRTKIVVATCAAGALAVLGLAFFNRPLPGTGRAGRNPFAERSLSAAEPAKTKAAAAADWPCLYGPTHDGVCTEANLRSQWPPAGPPLLWRQPAGDGYSQPVVVGEKVVLFHRKGDQELVSCKRKSDGGDIWNVGAPTAYVDRYGYNGGPRSTPIVSGERIFTLGAEGRMQCLRLRDGAKAWGRDLNREYKVEQGFFGVGASPLLEGDRLIVNVGGKETQAGIIAVAASDGKTLWTATNHGASYATPIAGTVHGLRHVFVFTEAGLVSLNPADGAVRWSIPFRSKTFESVNATSPLLVDDVVVISAAYRTGALAVRLTAEGGYTELWRNRNFPESHFSNMIHVNGFLYGFTGRHEQEAELFCCELATGKMKWRTPTMLGRGQLLKTDDRFLLWGERGRLASIQIDSEKFSPLCTTDLDAAQGLLEWPTWTPPAIADGRMYLRNDKQLLCLDLRRQD